MRTGERKTTGRNGLDQIREEIQQSRIEPGSEVKE
jgi:hypothetical protein